MWARPVDKAIDAQVKVSGHCETLSEYDAFLVQVSLDSLSNGGWHAYEKPVNAAD